MNVKILHELSFNIQIYDMSLDNVMDRAFSKFYLTFLKASFIDVYIEIKTSLGFYHVASRVISGYCYEKISVLVYIQMYIENKVSYVINLIFDIG